jgi:hypothetical protein
MERHLILLLALVAAAVGTSAAVLRPGVFQIGQSQPPTVGSGVVVRSGQGLRSYRGESTRPGRSGRARWQSFQGRGPGGAK